MSEEMAVSDNTTGDEAKVSNDEATTATVAEPEEVAMETPAEPVVPAVEEPPALAEEDPGPEIEPNIEKKVEVKEEPESDYVDVPLETPLADVEIKKEEELDVKDEIETFEHNIEEDLKRGIKRRASSAFSDVDDEDFKGFDEIKLEVQAEDYNRILERLEAEVTAARRDLVPLRTVMATPPAPGRASKRPRKDTDGSRPSSALSSRSDGDGATDVPPKKMEFKNQKRTKFKYTEEALAQALQAVRTKSKGIREPCLDHGVPRTTVEDLLSGRAKEQPRRVGPEPILGINGERKVVEWVKELAKRGFSVSKEVLLKSVAILINEIGKENNFPEGRARKKWYLDFLSRHPDINIEPEGNSKAREAATDSSVRKWFKGLEDFLTERGMADIMKDPSRIFNADETRFSLSPKSGKLLAPEGYKNDEKFKRGNKTLTVFIMMSASGMVCPPLLVFACKLPSIAILENVPGDWLIGRSESGRMNLAVFYEYIANGFNNWLVDNNVKKPVIVFVDGHKSQKIISMPSSKFCEENGIIFYALPTNTARIMPPAEVSVLRPLKQDWKYTLRNWQAKPENLNETVTKTNFSKVLKEILNTDMTQTIRNGFRNCGIFPFDVNAVDSTKCVDNFQGNWQARSPSSGELTKRDFSTAIRVMALIKDNLLEKGINPYTVCNEIELAKSSFKELITEGINSSMVESCELTSADDMTKINIDTAGDGVDNDSLLVELRSIPN